MRILSSLLIALLMTACASTQRLAARSEWTKGAMVAAADPRAVEAGLEVLRRGGHAVDAAIAVHAVLGLVEPQSSGLGGGGFMVVYERATGKITVYDGRETAPARATPGLFLDADGKDMGFLAAWQSGASTGVPGAVALYAAAHEDHGRLAWGALFEDAIALADRGFVVSPRLAELLSNERLRRAIRLDDDDNRAAQAYFYPGGTPLAAGDVRTNVRYAETLRRVAEKGRDGFYQGDTAAGIVLASGSSPHPGLLEMTDLANYSVIERDALCSGFRAYRICSVPPPGSGGMALGSIMGLYERFTAGIEGTTDADVLSALVDAQRLAYADRDHYIADADNQFIPFQALIDPAYLDVRASERSAPDAAPLPGDPGAVLHGTPYIDMYASDLWSGAPGTTHISIVDAEGNAVSMTMTVEAAFGNSRMVGGFLLNNELTDFSRVPEIDGKPVANAPGPGKRPRSSMSPTLVFGPDGDLFMVTGSPGGNSIIAYVAKTLVGVLDAGMSAQEAVDRPNIIARGLSVGVEVDVPSGPAVANMLKARGYPVQEREGENSGLHVIVVREEGLEGAADPRREGVARALDGPVSGETPEPVPEN